jgi:hypothetical protein
MDAVEQTLEQKLSRLSQVDNTHNAQFSLPHTHKPLSLFHSVFLCFSLFTHCYVLNYSSVENLDEKIEISIWVSVTQALVWIWVFVYAIDSEGCLFWL